jgi:hypothetical protein
VLRDEVVKSRNEVSKGPAVNDDRPPICPACGVTMVPADLSERGPAGRDWVCLECEQTDEVEEDFLAAG